MLRGGWVAMSCDYVRHVQIAGDLVELSAVDPRAGKNRYDPQDGEGHHQDGRDPEYRHATHLTEHRTVLAPTILRSVAPRIMTSSLSLARELWRYGEAQLADRARRLKPKDMIELGERAGEIQASGEGDRLWSDGPRGDKALLLAATELLEGTARPTQRARRLPEARLPAELLATGQELLDAANEVSMEELRLTLQRQKGGR